MLLSEIEFGSFLSYSPNGVDEKARESQAWVRNIKEERPRGEPPIPTSMLVASRLKARLLDTELAELLTPNAILVPAPRSSLLKKSSLWVPHLLARALVEVGLGREVVPCLERVRPMRKAATSTATERPLAREHYDSMRTRRLHFMHDEVVVIDDVVTRGATLLAAVSRMQAALPGASVRGFAVVRTVSNPRDFQRMFAPCRGRITLSEDGQTIRRP